MATSLLENEAPLSSKTGSGGTTVEDTAVTSVQILPIHLKFNVLTTCKRNVRPFTDKETEVERCEVQS